LLASNVSCHYLHQELGFSASFASESLALESARIVRSLLLYLYTDELAFGDTVKLLVDVLCKAKELELTRVCNHCEQRCERGLSAQNAVLLFMLADEYALEGLRKSALRYNATSDVSWTMISFPFCASFIPEENMARKYGERAARTFCAL